MNNKVDAADNVLNLSPLSSHLRQASSVPAITIKDDDIPKPTGVKLSVDGTKVQVDWTEVSLADSYTLQQSTSSTFATKTDITISSGSTTSHKITSGLTSGTTYYFRLIAEATGYEDSAPSDVVSVTPTTGDVDYDADNDGLIDVDTLAKLNAIRWDLDGDGVGDKYDSNGDGDYTDTGEYDYTSNYTGVFSSAEDNMGCGESAVSISSQNTGNPTCKGYEITANLDFDTDGDGDVDSGDTYWNSGAGWTPIGDAATGYTGEFEGNGATYTISNLFINSTTSSGSAYAGLFGVIGSGGEVKNVKLEDVDVTAAVTSTTSTHEVYAGALAGKNSGTVSGSSSLGEVAMTRSGGTSAGKGYAGGLVGWNDGTVVSSYSRAEVTATSDDANEAHAGGLAALNDTGDTIAASFATGSVTATTTDTGTLTNTAHAGGLVGHNKGTITASYAHGAGTVKGNKVARGGFAATNASGATITASFSTGSHSGSGTGTGATTASGGLVATHTGSTVTNSYWDTTTSGITATGAGTGKTTSELQTPTTRTGIYSAWNVDADPTQTGTQDPWDFGTNKQYPAIKHGLTAADQRAAVTVAFSPTSICESSAGTNTNACGASPVTSSTMTATISPAQEVPVTLTFSTNAAVYTLKSGNTAKSTITIAAGSTSGTLTVGAVNNKTDAANNSVTLTPATGRNWVNVTGASLTITDEDIVAKPTGVKISVDGANVQLDWTAVTDATGYTVQRSTSSTFTTTTDTTVTSGSTTTLKITSGLTSGTTYYFRVIATATGYDDSTPSDSVSATPTTTTVDYDNDNNGLIGVDTLAKLNAIRWDLDGDGAADDPSNQASYDLAFPNAEDNMGCGEEVASISSNDTGNPACRGYELTKDLDFDTGTKGTRSDDTYWNSGAGWEPIGGVNGGAYTGEFDGQTFTISNLYIDRTSGNYAGLFAYLNGTSQTVENVSLINVDVTFSPTAAGGNAKVYTGGLAGRVGSGVSIEGSYTTGRVRAGGSATETVTFSAALGSSYVGGLVGDLDGAIVSGYSHADVTAYTKSTAATIITAAGGLAGRVNTGGSIAASYARGAVAADMEAKNSSSVYAGGLVGYLNGNVRASYARGAVDAGYDATDTSSVTGSAQAGGLVGLQAANITASYSTGAPDATGDGTPSEGGLVGSRISGTTTDAYWDTDTSGITATGQGTGKTTSQLQTPTAYGTGANDIYKDWDIDLDTTQAGTQDPWHFGTSKHYPVLKYGLTPDDQRATVTLAISPSAICETTAGSDAAACGSDNVTTATVTPTVTGTFFDATTVTLTPACAINNVSQTASTCATLGASSFSISTSGAVSPAIITVTAVNDKTNASHDKAVTIAGSSNKLDAPVTSSDLSLTVKDDDVMAKPTGLKLSVDGTKVQADWDQVSNAGGYTLQWRNTSDSWASPTGSATKTGATSTRHSILTGLTSGTQYYFRVIATKTGFDDSAPSDVVSVTPTTGTVDYDADNDGLIEITTLAKLNAIRWDLDGDGVSTNAGYATAFPNAEDNMGCGESAGSISSQNTGNPTCKGYELAANLDFDTGTKGTRSDDTYWNSGAGWEPIGGVSGSQYTGDFDGQTFTISNLYIDRTSGNYAGLFAYLNGGSGTTVKNISLVNVDVTFNVTSGSSVHVGGLAGRAGRYVTLEDSYTTGRVRAGESATEPVTLTASPGYSYVGGLVGRARAAITGSYSLADVTSNTKSASASPNALVGGLVGEVRTSGSVTASYAAGDVTANIVGLNSNFVYAGGLVGQLEGDITASYARGAVTATSDATVATGITGNAAAGGLVGTTPSGSGITASFSTGAPTATGDGQVVRARGLVGFVFATASFTNSYWDTDTSGITTTGAGTGKTTSELQTPTAYGTGSSIYASWNLNLDGETGSDDPWAFGTASQYPVLKYGGQTESQQRVTVTLTASPTTIWERALTTPSRVNQSTLTATPGSAWDKSIVVTVPTNAAVYTLGASSLTFNAGSTTAQTTTMTAVNNFTDAANNAVSLAITADSPWVTIGTAPTVTINDDDELAKPTGVRLSVDGTKIRVDWTQVTGATGYKVQWNTSDTWTSPSEGTVSSGSTVTYTIDPTPALTADTRYYVRVLPTKSGADEPPSDVVDVKTHATSPATVDYDADNDGLIEITTLAQLDAVRWDLDGDGVADDSSDQSSYDTAFPNAEDNMGCNESAATISAGTGNPAVHGLRAPRQPGLQHQQQRQESSTNPAGADSGDTYWNSGTGWLPIGMASASPYTVTAYTGSFDGNADTDASGDGGPYTISNLFIRPHRGQVRRPLRLPERRQRRAGGERRPRQRGRDLDPVGRQRSRRGRAGGTHGQWGREHRGQLHHRPGQGRRVGHEPRHFHG